MTFKSFLPALALGLAFCASAAAPDLKINDLEYYETRGVNLLVYSNLFTGGFNDEKNSGIELIHHGVRTAQGGAAHKSSSTRIMAQRNSGTWFPRLRSGRWTGLPVP